MWPSYVINLAANTRRMANAAAQLAAAGMPFERIEAVWGAGLSPQEVAAVYDAARNAREGRHPLVPAEIGCYLSHIAAWTRIAEGDAAGGFIFEDDFAATPELAPICEALSAEHDDWDMVKLFSFDPDPPAFSARPLAGGRYRLVEPYRVPTCLIGYALTRQAACRLKERAIPFFRPVDEDQKFLWETGLVVKLVVPQPVRVGDQQAATGTIGASRRAAAAQDGPGRLARALAGLRYQWNYRRGLRRHWAARRREQR